MNPLFNSPSPLPLKQQLHFFSRSDWSTYLETSPVELSPLFKAKKGEVKSWMKGEEIHYFVGLGEKELSQAELQKTAREFSAKSGKDLQEISTSLHFYSLSKEQQSSLLTGLLSGTYSYKKTSEHPFQKEGFGFELENYTKEELQKLEERVKAIVEGERVCKEWLNKPANQKTPPLFGNFLKEESEKYGWKHLSLSSEECLEKGLGAFMAVAKGSHYRANFTVIEYGEPSSEKKTIGLVGKSIVFDTGGISLKNPDNMHYMKSDMGGGCAVLGFLITATLLQLPVHIVAAFPITDNAVSSRSYLPSDVVKSYSGKEIEVLNTDAEGRLALADGLSYLKENYELDYLIDLATLTGSAVRMFGDQCGVLFSNDDELLESLQKAGDETGQRLWPLPLWDSFNESIQSEIADLRNIALSPVSDCIYAAKFLEHFILNHPRWAHLDIAGVAFGQVPYAKEKSATGYGVQLLLKFTENLL